MFPLLWGAIGAAAAVAGRSAMAAMVRRRFARGTRDIARGDRSTMLAAYAEDAVIHFHPGTHRFGGDWVGKKAIDRFLQNLVAVRLQGEFQQLTVIGPPWAMNVWVHLRFSSDAEDGTRLYENSTVLLLRTRWGKVVEQHDFYRDSEPLNSFETLLTERGIAPIR